jgi:hypothetical protein
MYCNISTALTAAAASSYVSLVSYYDYLASNLYNYTDKPNEVPQYAISGDDRRALARRITHVRNNLFFQKSPFISPIKEPYAR